MLRFNFEHSSYFVIRDVSHLLRFLKNSLLDVVSVPGTVAKRHIIDVLTSDPNKQAATP